MKLFYTCVTVAALAWSPILASTAIAQVNFNLIVSQPPPPPQAELLPAPRQGYAWVPGYWGWNGDRHVWSNGHWEAARVGQRYERPEWQRDGDKWRLKEGGWKQVKQEKKHKKHHEDHDDDDEEHGHQRNHCPPGQAKKGNC